MNGTMAAWKIAAADFKSSVNDKIPKEWRTDKEDLQSTLEKSLIEAAGVLTSAELALTELDATALRDAIRAGTYTSVEVTTAYAKAAAVAHQATNCLFDFYPDVALERARWLDQQLATTGKPFGPLHGVPISIKDHLSVEGTDLTCGFLTHVGRHRTLPDSVIIRILRDAGAIFILKSAVPQAMMHLDCDSFNGPCLNPWNKTLSPGGSSGGEAALVSAKASVLGIGTDIGGSIRQPAAACGIFGFKPTSSRIPRYGNMAAMGGQEAILGAFGPMARSARDVNLFVQTVLDGRPWETDPGQVGMPWRMSEVHFRGDLATPKVGVMWDDGVVTPHPPIQRAMKHAVSKLRAAGVEVVEFTPYKMDEAWELLTSLYFTDGGAIVRDLAAATGEPILPLTEWILSHNTQSRSPAALFSLIKQREAFRAAFARHYAAADVDVVLSPASFGPAQPLGTNKYWSYTGFWNLVDYPGAVFPTGLFVDKTLDVPNPATKLLGETDRAISSQYQVEQVLGAPLSLQLTGARWEDEKVVAALEIVSDIVRK